MATASKTSKPAKKAVAATPKAAQRAAVKSNAKAAAASAKPLQGTSGIKKAAAPKHPAPKAAASAPQPKKIATPAKPPVPAEQRRHYIEVAAYFIAERRGFPATSVLDDWTQAEAQIDRLLSEGKLNP